MNYLTRIILLSLSAIGVVLFFQDSDENVVSVKQKAVLDGQNVVKKKPTMESGTRVYGQPSIVFIHPGYVYPLHIELPVILIEDEDENFGEGWELGDREQIKFTCKKGVWEANGLIVEVEDFVSRNVDASFSIVCDDSMPLNELKNLLESFDDNFRILKLVDTRGKVLEVDFHFRYGCLYKPTIEPMLIELTHKGVIVNLTEFVSEVSKLNDLLVDYQNMANVSCVEGRIELLLSEKNGDLGCGHLLQIVRKYPEFHFEILTKMKGERVIGNDGGSRSGDVQYLPSSPHVRKTRWKVIK